MPTLLAVDDEADTLRSLAAYLEATVPGLRVATAPSGPAALEALARGTPDIVLSDHRMPGMSGLELLIQAARRHPGVPRILMTAYGDTDLVLRAMEEARVRQFLAKPVDPERLAALVKEVLGESAGRGPA